MRKPAADTAAAKHIEVLLASGWTVEDIAARLDVNYHTVLRWRAGTHNPLRSIRRRLFQLTPKSAASAA